MSDPIGQCRMPAVPTSDDVLRDAFSGLPPAMGLPPRPGASATHVPEDSRGEVVAHGTTTAIEGGLHIGGAALEGTVLGMVAELAGGVMGWVQLIGAWFEGDRRGTEYDSNVLRGALMALEGRMDEIPANDLSGLRDGARRVEYLAMRDPEAFARLRESIGAIVRDGANAVYTGRDSGCEFEQRYQHDLAFRRGVDAARQEGQSDPAAFEAHRRVAMELEKRARAGRGGAMIRG